MSSRFLSDFYQQLNPDNTMTFNRLLAHSIGAVETIIFFTLVGKYYYYADHDMLDDDGWFYVTVPDLHESSTFGEKTQRNSIKHLENLGFIKTVKKGVPAKRYFKINNDINLIQEYLVKGKEISDSIKNKAAENNAKKVAARHEKSSSNNVFTQFLPFGGTSSAEFESNKNKNENLNKESSNNSENSLQTTQDSSSSQRAELVPPKRRNLSLPNGGTSSAQMADKSKTNKSKTNKSISINQDNNINNINNNTYRCDDLDSIDEIDIKNQLNYEKLIGEHAADKKQIDSIIKILTDVMSARSPTIRIARENKPVREVRQRFLELTDKHITYVLESMAENSERPRNIKAYLLTALYNAPATMEFARARERPSSKKYSFDMNEIKSLVNTFEEDEGQAKNKQMSLISP